MMKTDDYNDQSVTEEKLKDGAITTRKIADGSVTKDKLAPSIRQEINESVTASNEATEKAKEATAKADQATENAKQATAAATAAKEAADTATQLATNATTASAQATEQAKAATTKAEESAAKANEAAQRADDSREQTEQTLGTMQEVVDKVAIKDEEGALVETPVCYIQNEEFIFANVDAEDKLLFGIQWDGTPVFGKTSAVEDRLQSQVNLLADKITTILGDEDTTNVIDTMNELKKFFAEIENTETLTSILANLNSLNTKFGEDIKNLQDTKVDKEEGKSLIEDEVKECFKVIENEEFIKAVVDSDDKVLFGFRRDTGKPYYPLNEMYHVIQNEEYFAVWVTTDDKVVLGLRRDGEIIGEIHAVNALKQVISELQEKLDTIYSNTKELLNVLFLQENPEYLAVEKDADGRVLSTTNNDGSHYLYKVKSETIPTEFSHIEDPEGRMEITTDAEGKVLSYRDSKGIKFEKNIKTDNLELSSKGTTDFIKTLKASGLKLETPCDWSNYISNGGEKPLHLPIPQCAAINISNVNHDAVWPLTKGNDYEYYMEYYDMLGNYFKKNIIMNAQGNSSMVMIKKNGAIDIFDSSVYDAKGNKGKGNSFGIQFGNWVAQDSFHLKAFYNDFFKGCSFVVYQIANEVMESYGITKDRPWKRALIGNYIGTGQEGKSINDISLQIDNGARCMPDGFPCIVYLNGDFYGIYTFALKKHRDNYHMKKKEGKHIHLDGTNIDFFNGKIDWSGFEVRNPKDSEMCCTILKEGTSEYLPYSGGKELLGDDAEHYNPENKAHVLSNKVKRSIEKLSKRCQEVNALSSNEEKKAYLEKYFDVDSILDYILVATAVHDTDGGYANYQWITYDGEKWFVCNYDKDRSFGNGTEYMEQAITTGSWIYQNITIFKLFEDLFSTELKEKWNGYVKKGIFTYDNFIGKISQWVQRIGQDNYKKEYLKWKQAPCNRDDNVNRDYWKTKCRADQWYWWQSFKAGDFCFSQENEYKVYKALKSSNNVAVTNTEYWQEVTYSPETNYNVGDICGYGFHFGESFYVDNGFYAFEAIAASNNTPPISKIYDEYPRVMGYRDNIWRVSNYIEQTLNTIQKYVDSL